MATVLQFTVNVEKMEYESKANRKKALEEYELGVRNSNEPMENLPSFLEKLYCECPHARGNMFITSILFYERSYFQYASACMKMYLEEQRALEEAADAMLSEEELAYVKWKRLDDAFSALRENEN